jgi:hypothetical protein
MLNMAIKRGVQRPYIRSRLLGVHSINEFVMVVPDLE